MKLLTGKILKNKILELVTWFVTSKCLTRFVTRFCKSGIIEPFSQ